MIGYLQDKITGGEVSARFARLAEEGRREKKKAQTIVRLPYTRSEGKELAGFAAQISGWSSAKARVVLSPEQVRDIKLSYKQSEITMKNLTNMYGVSVATVFKAIHLGQVTLSSS